MMVVLLDTMLAPTISSFAALVVTKPLSAMLLFPLAPADTSSGFDCIRSAVLKNPHVGLRRSLIESDRHRIAAAPSNVLGIVDRLTQSCPCNRAGSEGIGVS